VQDQSVDWRRETLWDTRGINHDILVEHIWDAAITSTLDAGPMEGMTHLRDGQMLQLDILRRYCDRGEALGGWKVGLTSGDSRDAFGKGFRPFGFILVNRILKSNETLHLDYIKRCGVECELSFVIGEHLAGDRVTAAMVRKAVYSVAPAFEITESRIIGPADPGIRIADNLSQWGIAMGKQIVPVPMDYDYESLEVVLTHDGEEVQRAIARGQIDDHFESIAALVRELFKFGMGLRNGQRIITGSLTGNTLAKPGRWQADFSEFGSVAVNFV
jgi:2-keto-4-pentenoate hydratase